ncbi:MAG: hypothetical protein HYV42_02965 [Candidatus Magasanikbacteria bacterium]|nr:hypothetical protein [Candidatus Magasanikbacteria bacterium]
MFDALLTLFILGFFLLLFLTTIPFIPVAIVIILMRRRPVILISILVLFLGGFAVELFLDNGSKEIFDPNLRQYAEEKLQGVQNSTWSHDNWTFPATLVYRIATAGEAPCWRTINSPYVTIIGYSWWLIPTVQIDFNCHGESRTDL